MATNLHFGRETTSFSVVWRVLYQLSFNCFMRRNFDILLLMLPNHSHNQSHPHLLILSQFVSRFPDQPNQTATQLPTWKCFQKSFAKVKKSSGDQNRTQKSDPKIDFHNGDPLFLDSNHEILPMNWCKIITNWHLGHGVALSDQKNPRSNYSAPVEGPVLNQPCTPVWLAMMAMVIFKSHSTVSLKP